MGVSLYTARIVINALGIEDYGIYNIVGGLVVLFAFFNEALVTGARRFVSFELGRGHCGDVIGVFHVCIRIHLYAALLIVILAETVGLYFFTYKLQIPVERQSVASVVYQLSVLTMVASILRNPYSAVITAHEHFGFYVYSGFIESGLKFLSAIALIYISVDSLGLYGILVLVTSILVTSIHYGWCKQKYHFVNVSASDRKKERMGEISVFLGWSLLEGVAKIAATQGINIIINLFLGVIVNAAMGIATQISSVFYQFAGNFQIAFSPQIVKLYAAGDYDKCIALVAQCSRFSFFLMCFIIIPLFLYTPLLIHLWIGEVPVYAGMFTRLLLVSTLLHAINSSFSVAIQATGDIRKYQIVNALLGFVNLILVYVLLYYGGSPDAILLITLVIMVILTVVRIQIIRQKMKIYLYMFLKDIFGRICCFSLVIFPMVFFMKKIFPDTLIGFVGYSGAFAVINSAVIYTIGLSKSERALVILKGKKILRLCS